MKVFEIPGLPGLRVVEPTVHRDERGFFFESYQSDRYRDAGVDAEFVQDNNSGSGRGALRGLHFQHPYGQGKLVQALAGEVFDAVVDVRVGSPGFGRWYGTTLSAETRRQLFIPAGFAHGFMVVSEFAEFAYKCTDFYHPECDHTLLWNDPDVGVEWPAGSPVLSEKDRSGRTLHQLLEEGVLPKYAG